MYNIVLRTPTTYTQQFFIERSLELLFKNTLDTYRLRLNNPRTVIQELASVCDLMDKKELTNNDYARALGKEVQSLIKYGSDELSFIKVSREYYLKLINQNVKNFKILQASKLILDENRDYSKKLLTKIKSIIAEGNTENTINFEKLTLLNKLIQFFLVELVEMGFSKPYLHNFFYTNFVNSTTVFDINFQRFESLITRISEKFTIIFSIQKGNLNLNKLKKINNNVSTINYKIRRSIRIKTNSKVADYLDEVALDGELFSIEITALDYYSAVNYAINSLAEDFDIYHLGHSDLNLQFFQNVVAIGENDPSKAKIITANFQLDGYYRSNSEVFEKFLETVNQLNSLHIKPESKRKVRSAIRYLRLGTESNVLENKLLNYWIGLEYIFTFHLDENSTIGRIRDIFPRCHALIYLKRNLNEFHKAIDRTKNSHLISDYNENLDYLCHQNTYRLLIQEANSVLLKFRANEYLKYLQKPESIKTVLRDHQENLNLNLTRLYRIRNEIVHNAAIKNSITTNASHLRYYLTFILNSILFHLINYSNIPINDEESSIEDFFISQDIILGTLEENSKLEKYLKVTSPFELFS